MTNILLYQILAFIICKKRCKSRIITINLKFQVHRGRRNLNYLIDHILYQMFKIFQVLKKYETVTDNLLIRIYVNKIEHRTFDLKTMELFENTKTKLKKHKNREKVPYLEITEVVFS